MFGKKYKNEFDLPPLSSALRLYWLRSIWVLNMWAQASCDKIVILPPTQYGWIQEGDGSYSIQYDTDEHILIIRQRVSKFTRGCKCKGGCKTKICGCIKNGQQCGPGCRCLNCENLCTSDAVQLEFNQHIEIATEVEVRNTLKMKVNMKVQVQVMRVVKVTQKVKNLAQKVNQTLIMNAAYPHNHSTIQHISVS